MRRLENHNPRLFLISASESHLEHTPLALGFSWSSESLRLVISASESHLEHTPLALGFSWSSESLRLVTLGDWHHLDGLVALGAR